MKEVIFENGQSFVVVAISDNDALRKVYFEHPETVYWDLLKIIDYKE